MKPEPPETHVSSPGDSPESLRERPAPRSIGPYRIDGTLGRGGMGEVYRAWDPRLERKVAIKRVLSERGTPAARARFWREARVLAALKHPGLVALHDIGEDDGALYIAMELVEGAPLADARGHRLPPEAAVAIVLRVARALAAAHAVGVVHRDIKLSNILIEPSGEPRLIDFGLARRGDDDELTAEGTIVGTWSMMAPEQITGEALTPATDVHALGALAFALLSGKSPYERDSREASAAAILAGARPDLSTLCPTLDEDVVAFVARALARDPADRPASAAEVVTALEAIVRARGWSDAPEVIRRALAAAGTLGAPGAPLPGSSLVAPSRPRARRSARRIGVLAGVAAASIAVAALAWPHPETRSAASEEAAAPAVTPERKAIPEPVPRPIELPGQALGAHAVAELPRKVVAVVPRPPDDSARADLALASAEVIGRALAEAPDEIVLVSWRELAAWAPGVDPERLGEAALPRLHDVDVVVESALSTDGRTLRASLRTTGAAEPFAAWEVDVPPGAPLVAARALGGTIARELGAAVAPRGPRTVHVPAGVSHLVRAELAQHVEHWRAFRDHVNEALKADPRSPHARLAAVTLDLHHGRTARARETLAELVDDPALTPRDRSFADVQLAGIDGRSAERRTLLDAHLARFPRDVHAQIERMHIDFLAVGPSKLRLAADHAARLLERAPATPIVASKLVRAHGWLGDPGRARRALEARGLGADTPDLGYVFGELALYERDYPTAITLLGRALEPDGDLAFYPAHMLVAAHTLAGDYRRAQALSRKLAVAGDGIGIDWTWVLLFQALVGGGDLVEAEQALADWPDKDRPTPSTYRGYDRLLLGLLDIAPDALVDELSSLEGSPGSDWIVSLTIARAARDPEIVAGRRDALRAQYTRRLASLDTSAPAGFRMVEALEARLAHLVGDDERALEILQGLARGTSWEVRREGDLFERARWMAAWASLLDETGRTAQAEMIWLELRSLGYERLLAMDTTFEADRRLALAR